MPEPSGRSPKPPLAKPGLHPRNRHAGGYDFPRLVQANPELGPFVQRAKHGGLSIDFADPHAVKALNRALLAEAYGIRDWDIPLGYLCPPIPGRADYVHHLADLLATDGVGAISRGPALRALDVGVGANAIYPLIGHREYGWSFVGSDIDEVALTSAARILAANPGLGEAIQLRRQADRNTIFGGVLQPGERFDLTLCNPPFHGSLREVREAAQMKWRKLGRATNGPARNFGGQGGELWCEGGEVGFIRRMITESADLYDRVRWFTTLVSSSASLPSVHRTLRQVEARDIRTVAMAQGQKQSRFVAWTFLGAETRRSFRST
jgi:23S rRNA (adenine1618-N6)-methyltransferase